MKEKTEKAHELKQRAIQKKTIVNRPDHIKKGKE